MSRSSFYFPFVRRVGIYLLIGLALSDLAFLALVSRSLGSSYSQALHILQFTQETALMQALEINAILLALIVGLIFFASLMMSHRISGPVYRLEKTAETVAGGGLPQSIRLRKKDELRNVAREMEEAFSVLRQKLDAIKQASGEMHAEAESLGRSGREPGQEEIRLLKHRLERIRNSVDFFQV